MKSHCFVERGKRAHFLISCTGLLRIIVVFLLLFSGVVCAEDLEMDLNSSAATVLENPSDELGNTEISRGEEASDEYGDIGVEESEAAGNGGLSIADPIEPWNRAMYHFNDKFYFWLLKPVTQGYKHVVPEDLRAVFVNFYENIKAPIRIVNHLLQGRPGNAGTELTRFLINSTMGAGGLRDCAGDCFGIKGQDAGFGQTLGKYGVGFGFYLVWPILGPSCPRDTVGWLGDLALTPTTYVSPHYASFETSAGIGVHDRINELSFHLGDYEAVKKAAIDPYVAIRDAYVQHRNRVIKGENGRETGAPVMK
ncbi:MAG: putative phospholipid-binding lipoprotein MlaA precursor [Syntrophorhabdus sp. PtaB.Bin006]|nr:MAG: putative phospholipid-binding lipoprotein MlaA precursor [Syntrophorhabdus sp. PtaB.Bin006]